MKCTVTLELNGSKSEIIKKLEGLEAENIEVKPIFDRDQTIDDFTESIMLEALNLMAARLYNDYDKYITEISEDRKDSITYSAKRLARRMADAMNAVINGEEE